MPKRSTEFPVVAMIGGGQLARLTHQAAIALGQTLRVLAARPDDPAAQASPDVVIGSHENLDDLRRAAEGASVVTFDSAHVPTELLEKLVAEGVTVAPSPQALVHAQDRLVMRRRLEALGVPVLVEERVAMRRELAALVARSAFGQGAAWPVVQTVRREGIGVVVLAPAPGLADEIATAAAQLALHVADELGVVGVLAVELFETVDGGLLVNELAMRPHRSGYWTMDGANTSQFEQHLRAVLDYPLGDCAPIAPLTVMANVVGATHTPVMTMDERMHHLFARMPEAKVHLYGRAERPGVEIGHVNIVGGADGRVDDAGYVANVRERAERAAQWLSHAEWTDGWEAHG